jgi:GT2 family glycosyltransferase/MoaA/NifB/PqqE/SkfB family radical SAM enzyme
MTQTPLVSIVLLSLLRKDATDRCISSLYHHTAIPFEIIVTDMGASDEIVAWLRLLAASRDNMQVIYNQENLGTTKGRNQAISLAKGKYIMIMDNDTEVTERWLEPLLDAIESSPDVAACGAKVIAPSGRVMNCSQYIVTEKNGQDVTRIGISFSQHFEKNDPEVNQVTEVTWYPTTAMLVRKNAIDAIGGFDEQIFLCEEDKDLCLRLGSNGYKILYIPGSEVIHHHTNAEEVYTKIRNNLQVLLKDIRYFEKRWNCRVFINHSRTFLHQAGMEDPEIDGIRKFSFLNTIIEAELQLKELILTVTSRCNHHCRMCYYHENLNGDQPELTLEEYRKIASSMPRLNILWISGGEPFLRNDLPEICKIFVSENQPDHIFIPSNGSLPDRMVEMVRRIVTENPGTSTTIMFSMEGLSEYHDEMHGITGAFAQIEKSIRKLHFLRAKLIRQNLTFSILMNSVVTDQNAGQIPRLMDYVLKNLAVDAHSLTPMRGHGSDPSSRPPSGNTMLALYEAATPFFEAYAIRSQQSVEKTEAYKIWLRKRYHLWANILDGGKLPFQCQAGNLIGVMEPDGGIRVCETMPVTANIREFNYNFRNAWFSAHTDKARMKLKGCSCTHACFLNISDRNHHVSPSPEMKK